MATPPHPVPPKRPGLSPWAWVGIISLAVVALSCVACIVVVQLAPKPVAETPPAADPVATASPTPAAPVPAPSAAPPTGVASFDALSAQLRMGRSRTSGGFVGEDLGEDDDFGTATQVFQSATGPRVAMLMTMRELNEFSNSERREFLRAYVQMAENAFGDADILIAVRGRALFGASAVRIGSSPWEYQAGYTISETPLRAFFQGALPAAAPVAVTTEPQTLRGQLTGTADISEFQDCSGYSQLVPSHRLELRAPLTRMTLEVATEDQDLSILLRRPDGVFRCAHSFDEARIEGRFPVGLYEVWVGRGYRDEPGDYALTVSGS
ncbi:MAG: hypothetical protein AAGE52_10830 [Myxococcota bacterium]